jgi:hypothetical protein
VDGDQCGFAGLLLQLLDPSNRAATVALSKVTARFPQAQMEPAYKPNLTLRGLASLDVKV